VRTTTYAAATLGIALLLGGCATADTGEDPGSPDDPVTSPQTPAPEPTGPATEAPAGDVAADLTITLEEGGGSPVTVTLTCVPPGGDHPDPQGACSALSAAGGVGAFDPTGPDVMCTEQYGGPQTATVTGTVGGERVDADFSRVNGCEIGRWDDLAPLLGSAGGV